MANNRSDHADPTFDAVMSKMMAEYRAEQRAIYRRQTEIKQRPKVYVVSPYAGDVSKNVEAARKYCRFVVSKKCIPLASHLLYPQFLNDDDPVERELGTMFGMALLAMCDEVWVFGKEHSPGMKAEINEARHLKKIIRNVMEKTEVQNESQR